MSSVVDLLQDATFRANVAARTLDGTLDYNDLLAILQSAASGGVTGTEFGDMETLVASFNSASGPGVAPYLAYIANAVVNGDGANAGWTGGAATTQSLGNLAAGSDETQATRLVAKWFLGDDLPAPLLDLNPAIPIAYTTSSAPLFGASGLPAIDDVNQGNLADCYLMSSLAQIALNEPELIRSMIIDNGNGTYGIRFFVHARPVYVTVNTDLPVRTDSGGLAANHANSIWASLVEKAYAQLNEVPGYLARTAGNSYKLLDFGWPDPISEVAGRGIASYSATGRSAADWSTLQSTFANAVLAGQEVVVASYKSTTVNGAQQFMAPHMYSITGYDTATGLFTLRNPYGSDYGQTWLTSFQASMADLYAVQGGVFIAVTDSLATAARDAAVTGIGPSGDDVRVPYDDPDRAEAAQSDLGAVTAGLLAGTVSAIIAELGKVLAPHTGTLGELIIAEGGAYAVSAGFTTTLINATSPVTLAGGAADGQLVIAGTAGLTLTTGTGTGTIHAGGGNNLVNVTGGGQRIDLGSGADTVFANTGNNVIAAGKGSNVVLLGGGANQVASTGADIVAGSTGAATISATANAAIFLGGGGTLYRGGSGQATVVGSTGADTIQSAGNTQIWLGTNTDVVASAGNDTICGNSSAATISATGNALAFLGTGGTLFQGSGGAAIVVGGAGADTIRSAGNAQLWLGTNTDIVTSTGNDTICGNSSAATITAAGNAVIFLGTGGTDYRGGSGGAIVIGGAGADTLHSAGNAQIWLGSNTDLLTTAGDNTIWGGTGAATIVAGSGADLVALANGMRSTIVIEGFTPGTDHIWLNGYAASEPAAALGAATISHGTTQLTLTDGTHITFAGLTSLDAAAFL